MERYRKPIYCDWEFLTAIVSKQDSKTPCSDNSFAIDNEIASNIENLLICSDIKLYLNISSDFFFNLLSEIEKKRKKALRKGKQAQLNTIEKLIIDMDLKQRNNALHLHFNASKVHFNDSMLDTNQLDALFFSCESKEVCAKAMEEYGIIVICSENINDFKYLTFDQGVAIHKTEYSNWKQCLGGHDIVPCNSLIVVDNYILNDSSSIEENLIRIFDSLIPLSLSESIIFQLTIFATLYDDRGSKHYNCETRLKEIKTILSSIRPNINFSVSIIKCSKDKFHDRTIITNNLYIGCGAGFDLFKDGKSKKTTTVSVFHPFLNTHKRWSRKAYSDLLLDAGKVFNNASEYDVKKDYLYGAFLGNKQNRLLNQN